VEAISWPPPGNKGGKEKVAGLPIHPCPPIRVSQPDWKEKHPD